MEEGGRGSAEWVLSVGVALSWSPTHPLRFPPNNSRVPYSFSRIILPEIKGIPRNFSSGYIFTVRVLTTLPRPVYLLSVRTSGVIAQVGLGVTAPFT